MARYQWISDAIADLTKEYLQTGTIEYDSLTKTIAVVQAAVALRESSHGKLFLEVI